MFRFLLMNLRALVLLSTVSLIACAKSPGGCGGEEARTEPAAEPAAKPEPPAVAPPKQPAQALMRDHFEKAYEAREALVRGDLSSAQAAMKFLAEHRRAQDLPEPLRPALEAMQHAALATAGATTLREAADALAGTFARCGVCHKTAGKGPTIAGTPLPEGTDLESHMKRHHWATQGMWEGLVTGSDERFAAAAAVLKDDAPLSEAALAVGDMPKADLVRLDAHVHKLGEAAAAASDLRSRAETYARLLATCGTCHKLTKRGPQPEREFEPAAE